MSEAIQSTTEITASDETRIGEKLAPYNPTSIEVVSMALTMLQITPSDIVYDLGCGDARFLIEACKLSSSIKGYGVEYDRLIYEKAMANVTQSGLSSQITLLHDNVLNIDFSNATVIFIYLVPEGIRKIKDQLIRCLDKGVRIITYVFSIPDLTPSKVELYKGSTKVYYYVK